MADKIEQSIKGNNNSQQSLIIQADNNYIGLKTEDVVSIIKAFCYPDKEQIVSIVKETIESINKEQRKMPDKRIFVPLIQQLSYSVDDDYIKHSYQNLLKSSMDISKTVHPSFVSIISQLNSDEIKILHNLPAVSVLSKPLINVRMIVGQKQGTGITLIRNFSDIGYGICDYPGNICAYIENLERLKLIEIPPLLTLLNKDTYTKLKQHPAVLQVLKNNEHLPEVKFEYDEKFFQLTQFGIQFIQACSK